MAVIPALVVAFRSARHTRAACLPAVRSRPILQSSEFCPPSRESDRRVRRSRAWFVAVRDLPWSQSENRRAPVMHPTAAAQPIPNSPMSAATQRWVRIFTRLRQGQSRVMTEPSCRRYTRTHCAAVGLVNKSVASCRVIALRLYTSRSQCSQRRFRASPVISCQLAGQGEAMSISSNTSSETWVFFTMQAFPFAKFHGRTKLKRLRQRIGSMFFLRRLRLQRSAAFRDTSGR